jgi:hypothetical protein
VVPIDIKPGGFPNSVNCLNEHGVVPVAILTTEDFDATTVDHTTVTFEEAGETHVNKKSGEPRRHEEDVDGDGDTDLVFHFRLGDTDLTCDSTEGTLIGETFDGDAIEGSDAIRMVGERLVPRTGGTFTLSPKATITIGSGTFNDTVRISYVTQSSISSDPLTHIGLFFELTATYLDGTSVHPSQPYAITITYDQADVPVYVNEAQLGLYFWEDSRWVNEPTSVVDVNANTITAQPSHFSLWAVLADQDTVYLPIILK